MTFLELKALLNSIPDYRLNEESGYDLKESKVPGNYTLEGNSSNMKMGSGLYSVKCLKDLIKIDKKDYFWDVIVDLVASCDEEELPDVEVLSELVDTAFKRMEDDGEYRDIFLANMGVELEVDFDE